MRLTDFFDDLAQLNQIDWPLMHARYWYDTVRDNDRKRRRQAEFLVYKSFPWHLVTEIGVINTQMSERVDALLTDAKHKPAVVVHSNWYY